MSTFSGDEVSAVVLDIGSAWTRAGYAGEDTPKLVFPTSYGYLPEEETAAADGDAVMTESSDATGGDAENLEPYYPRRRKRPKKHKGTYIIGDAAVTAWRPHMEIKNPLVDGMIQDWDALEEIWDYIFWEDQLDIDPKEHPLFVTEAAWNSREIRETLTELAFEKYQTLAFYVAKNPVLSAFAAGRPTAIVLDCGANSTSCVPVVDGYVLKKGIHKQPIGGDFLSEQILQQFQSSPEIDVVPHYLIAKKSFVDPDKPSNKVLRDRPNTTNSYHKFMQMRVIHDFKESVCQVFETSYDELIISARPMKTFEFPDGFNTSFGPQRFNIPEILFSPQRFLAQTSEGVDVTSLWGIPEMIFHSINSCDIDVRPHLWNNIILTGGTTLLPGFADRINNELSMMMSGMKIKIHAPGNTIERKCSSWLGGSILASLGTFHQLWISQKEYTENGKSIVEKKCE